MKSKQFIQGLLTSFLLLISQIALFAQEKPTQSLSITPRLHSIGHFPYTGAYVNRNLSSDINIYYTRENTGCFIFKSFDLEDWHSIVNYLQLGAFQNFSLHEKFMLTAYAGYLFSQTTGFSDRDSDVWVATVMNWTINDYLSIENTTLVLNPVKTEYTSTLNHRLVLNTEIKDFLLSTYIWIRDPLDGNPLTVSGSLALNFPAIKFSKHLRFRSSFAAQSYLTNERPSYAMKNGFLFSLTFPLSFPAAE